MPPHLQKSDIIKQENPGAAVPLGAPTEGGVVGPQESLLPASDSASLRSSSTIERRPVAAPPTDTKPAASQSGGGGGVSLLNDPTSALPPSSSWSHPPARPREAVGTGAGAAGQPRFDAGSAGSTGATTSPMLGRSITTPSPSFAAASAVGGARGAVLPAAGSSTSASPAATAAGKGGGDNTLARVRMKDLHGQFHREASMAY